MQIMREWEVQRIGDDQPQGDVLWRIAQRICSRELCDAWRSSSSDACNCAFDNLRNYLEQSLLRTRYAESLLCSLNAVDDVVNQTLETMHIMLMRGSDAGPDDAAAFLKWSQTILIRKAREFVEKYERENWPSLEEHVELLAEQLVDTDKSDPLERLLHEELQQKLRDVLFSMRNSHYREVLLYTYLLELEDHEIAYRLDVSVQTVYMWRRRALLALRNDLKSMEVLHTLRE